MQVLAAAGIAGAAGLNVPLTILLVAVLARADQIDLYNPAHFLASVAVIVAAAAVLLVEIIVDKLPGPDSVNDLIQSPVRPLTGALLFASVENPLTDANVIAGAVAGFLLAGAVHWLKASVRRIVTETSAGHLNPFVSMAEDGVAAALIFSAAYVPVLSVVLLGVIVVPAALLVVRRHGPRPTPVRR